MSARTAGYQSVAQAFLAVARARLRSEAAKGAWPLPGDLRVHLWLYAQGLVGKTEIDPGAAG